MNVAEILIGHEELQVTDGPPIRVAVIIRLAAGNPRIEPK